MDPTDAMDDYSALQAGFDSTSDDDTTQSAKGSMDAGAGDGDKQPKDEPSTAAAPQGSKAEGQSEQPAADPYADLPPQVRDLLAVAARVPDLERNLAAVTEHSRRFEGQVRSLQSRLDKQTAAAGKTPQAIERIQIETHRYVRRVLTHYAAYRARDGLPMIDLGVGVPPARADSIAF